MRVRFYTKATISIAFAFLLLSSIIPLGYSTPGVETRYFRYLTAQFLFELTQGDNAVNTGAVNGYYRGVRVFKVSEAGVETEITAGTAVAIVQYTADGFHSATWNCPKTSMLPTDKLRIKLYWGSTSPPKLLSITFTTSEALGALQLDAVTWTVFYHMIKVSTTYYFYFNHPDYDSRIEGISWSIEEEKEWHDITAWQSNAQARQWNSISMFTFNLLTRQWNNISTFNLNLLTRTWQDIATSSFSLLSRFWQIIASWNFNFQILKWNDITTWIFNLPVIGWQNIAYWIFQLPALGWHNLVYWISQLEAVTVSRYPLYYFYLLIIGLVTFIIYISEKEGK